MSDPRLDPSPGLLARLLVRAARALLPRDPSLPALDEIRTVLVVRTDDRVGNALLTLPLVRALQAGLPRAQVDLLLAARRAHVIAGLPNVRVLPFEKRAGPWRQWRFLRDLRGRYDLVLDAAHWHAFSVTSALLSRWASRRWVVGADRGPARIAYTTVARLPSPGTPEVLAKVGLLQAIGLSLQAPPLETALGRGASPVSGRFAALNPGARKEDHRWPAARFGALAKALRDRLGLRPVVFWGPGEEAVAREVIAGSAGAAELAPPTDLEQLASAFRAASLVVTNDTGPMHLAVACGAPVVAIFLDEAGLRWAHPGARFAPVVAPSDEEPVVAAAARLLDSAHAAAEPARTSEGS